MYVRARDADELSVSHWHAARAGLPASTMETYAALLAVSHANPALTHGGVRHQFLSLVGVSQTVVSGSIATPT